LVQCCFVLIDSEQEPNDDGYRPPQYYENTTLTTAVPYPQNQNPQYPQYTYAQPAYTATVNPYYTNPTPGGYGLSTPGVYYPQTAVPNAGPQQTNQTM
jgi:hypothetical protein